MTHGKLSRGKRMHKIRSRLLLALCAQIALWKGNCSHCPPNIMYTWDEAALEGMRSVRSDSQSSMRFNVATSFPSAFCFPSAGGAAPGTPR